MITLVIIIIAIIAYLVGWIQIDILANKYYKQAMSSYSSGNYTVALKGEKTFANNPEGYIFTGGFEQVVNAYQSTTAWPKPPVFYKAQKMANDIINTKLTTQDAMALYNTYYQVDNDYLPQILLHVAQQYQAQGDNALAYQTYNLLYNSFPYNKQATTAQAGMNQLSGSATLSTSGAAN